ncbi:MAG TPA: YceI family protein [Steroidobacteraceae bacterium]|nr:YceI family protein [Steroidobacteraceae bacterium]
MNTKFRPCAAAAALTVMSIAVEAAPVTYTIDADHSKPVFEIRHMGLSTYRGRFDTISGSVTLDTAAKKGSADVAIAVASVSTGVAKLDEHLKTADFFDASTYPTITFKSTDFKFKGDQLVSISGDLGMHGVSKPVTLTVDHFACREHPFYKVPACGGDAHTVIKRLDWGGIGQKYPADILGADVTLRIPIEARAPKP